MSSGTPDYIREVREKFGAGMIATGSQVVVASTFTDLLTITGKGVIYGGIVYQEHTSTQKDSNPAFYIDDSIVLSASHYYLNRFAVYDPLMYPMVINMYDDVNFRYAVSLANGIKFEKQFKIVYEESNGSTPTIYYGIVYALL